MSVCNGKRHVVVDRHCLILCPWHLRVDGTELLEIDLHLACMSGLPLFILAPSRSGFNVLPDPSSGTAQRLENMQTKVSS